MSVFQGNKTEVERKIYPEESYTVINYSIINLTSMCIADQCYTEKNTKHHLPSDPDPSI